MTTRNEITVQSRAFTAFVDALREFMARRGMTITQLAELLGMRQPNLSRLLAGREGITLERAERIASACDMSLVEMLQPIVQNTC